MRGLQFRVGFGDLGAGFSQSESQLPKEPLTLPSLQLDAVLTAKILR
jgi:hypothetical protein